jgi:hypothetical protein
VAKELDQVAIPARRACSGVGWSKSEAIEGRVNMNYRYGD